MNLQYLSIRFNMTTGRDTIDFPYVAAYHPDAISHPDVILHPDIASDGKLLISVTGTVTGTVTVTVYLAMTGTVTVFLAMTCYAQLRI